MLSCRTILLCFWECENSVSIHPLPELVSIAQEVHAVGDNYKGYWKERLLVMVCENMYPCVKLAII